MSPTSQLSKCTKIVVWVVIFGCLWGAIFINGYFDSRRTTAIIEFMECQNRFNDKVVHIVERLTRTTQYNFDFNKSNKLLIKRIIETEIPDEIALLGKFPIVERERTKEGKK